MSVLDVAGRLKNSVVRVSAHKPGDPLGKSLHVLIVAFENGRWGPARLPRAFAAAGFKVFALCPSENALSRTRFLNRHFSLADTTSARRFETRLAQVMIETKPSLVVPCDEQTVACLHSLIRDAQAGRSRQLTPAMVDILIASIGAPEHFDDMLLKTHTLALARKIGVPIPESRSVANAREAVNEAERIGYPVYVKTSFSWAGLGATLCANAQEVVAAIDAARPRERFGFAKRWLKKALGRDWYPVNSPIDVQKAIAGAPAMYNAVALGGKALAGFAGLRHEGARSSGPSSVVWLGAHAEMEKASNAMIEAMGASGFVNFDFMIEEGTGKVYLLECNPRPSQVMHLGATVDVDLFRALARGLRAETPVEQAPRQGGQITALFPQEWLRDSASAFGYGDRLDAPTDDKPLLEFMLRAGDGDTESFIKQLKASATQAA